MSKKKGELRFAMLVGPKAKPITEFGGNAFPKDVGTIIFVGQTSKYNEVNVVRINEFKGKSSLDVRRFYEKDGEWAHGKGTSFRAGDAGDFLEALAQNSGRIIAALSAGVKAKGDKTK